LTLRWNTLSASGTGSPLASAGFTGVTASGSTGGIFWFAKAGAQKGYIYGQDNDVTIASTDPSGVIRLLTGGNTERLRIDSSGRLLVGTASTSANVRALFQATSANASGGCNIYLARGSTPADGADLGSILFSDNGHSASAYITAVRDGGTWTSGSSQPTRIQFYTTADGASSLTERMRIDSSGNVGIAAAGQQAGYTDYGKAIVFGTSAETSLGIVLRTGTSGTGSIAFADNSGSGAGAQDGLIEYNQTNRALNFHTAGNSSPRLVIDSSGRVGVGTSSPGAKLQVNQDASDQSGAAAFKAIGTAYGTNKAIHSYMNTSNANKSLLYVENGSGVVMNVNGAGNVGVGTTSPSALLHLSADSSASLLVKNEVSSGPSVPQLQLQNDSGHNFSVKVARSGQGGFTTIDFNAANTNSNFLSFVNDTSEVMHLDGSGRVGIGTSSLNTKFDVAGSSQTYTSAPAITFTDTGSGQGDANRWIAGNLAVNNYGDFALAVAPDTTSTSFSPKIAVTEAGNVGIGITNPGNFSTAANKLVIGDTSSNAGMTIRTSNTSSGNIWFADADTGAGGYRGYIGYSHATNSFTFGTNASDRLTIDSSGRLLVGTSTARDKFFNTTYTPQLQLEGVGQQQSMFSLTNSVADNGGPVLALAKQRSGSVGGNTIVNSGDTVGQINFFGSDGTEMVALAEISASVDGTPGANDMPGRLVFSTTADGASSPTERMRISSSGAIGMGGAYDLGASDRLSFNPTDGLIGFGMNGRDSYVTSTAGCYIYSGSGSSGTTLAGELILQSRANISRDISFVTGSTPTLRARIAGSGDFQFNNGYGSVATAYGVRAWVNFNGKNTVSIRNSRNVSSITDQGTGLYQINFNNAMPDANYAAVGSSGEDTSGGTPNHQGFKLQRHAPTTTEVRVATANSSGGPTDHQFICCSIVR